MLPSFRNQSVDLDSKSIDWLLYECNIDLIWVNGLMSNLGNDELTFRKYRLLLKAVVQRCSVKKVFLVIS